MKNKQIENWEKATEALTVLFLKKYFTVAIDCYWISAEVGGTLCVNDYFFSIERIVEAIKYKATTKQLFDFNDLEIETLTKGKEMKTNFRNYIKNNGIIQL